jgi:feruloyl esterase
MKFGKSMFLYYRRVLMAVIFLALIPVMPAIGEEAQNYECAELTNLKIENTNLLSTTIVPAGNDLPEYCRVVGYVRPAINFEVRMPTADYTDRFLLSGCGGACGSVGADRPKGATNNAINFALKRNYAVTAHDGGHWGSSPVDHLYAYNNRQGEIDWGYRAVHELAVMTKKLIKAYYGKDPKYSYFAGCSTGGRMAAMEAQRFPKDFDGILSGAPVLSDTGNLILLTYFYQANRDADGNMILQYPKLKLIADAVYAAGDEQDGLKDGIITDPRNVDFDPDSLLCKNSEAKDCLTKTEIDVLKKFYGGVKNSKGESIYVGKMPYGSEAFWWLWVARKGGVPGINDLFVSEGLKYKFFEQDPGPAYNPMDFDFDRDPARMEFMGEIYNADNPDLSEFHKEGGKLIMYHGWADAIVLPFYTVDYYERVVKKTGSLDKTQDFYRLFMIPGMDHCGILPGKGPDQIDWLTAIENWVEKGQHPQKLIASQLDKNKKVERTRPVCPYPQVATWDGAGDPDDAGSFICQ